MKENIVNYIPLKIYRYLRWLRHKKSEYRTNKDNFSEEYARLCFAADKASYKGKASEIVLAAYQAKDHYILDYLNNLLYDVIEKYRNYEYIAPVDESGRTIWALWWQGEENAPDIVKACIRSIRKNANGHKVILLSKENYLSYITLPETIVKKHAAGIISHAAYSDMIRLSLLSKYGGMWIDATVSVSQPIPEELFQMDFFTLKTYNPQYTWVSKSRWTGYYLAGKKGFPFFSFARDALFWHWQKTDYIIDYLLLDYVSELAYQNIPIVRKMIDDLPDNNIRRGKLMEVINNEYDPELFRMLETGETFASKLSWRYGNPVATTKDGRLTNYGYLIRG